MSEDSIRKTLEKSLAVTDPKQKTAEYTVKFTGTSGPLTTNKETIEKQCQEIRTAILEYNRLQNMHSNTRSKIELVRKLNTQKSNLDTLCTNCLQTVTRSQENREILDPYLFFLKETMEITLGYPSSKIVQLLTEIGSTYLSQELYPGALNSFTKAIQIMEHDQLLVKNSEEKIPPKKNKKHHRKKKTAAIATTATEEKKAAAVSSSNEHEKTNQDSVSLSITTDKIDPAIVGKIFYGMGQAHYQLEQFTETLVNYKIALKIRQETFGEHSNEVMEVLSSIADTLHKQKMYPEALETYQQILDIISSSKDPAAHCRNRADILHNMGNTYLEQNDYPQACLFFTEALNLEIEIYGKHSPQTIETRQNLGSTEHQQKRYQQALELYEENRQIELANDDYRIVVTLTGMGKTYLQLGNYQSALDAYCQVITAGEKYAFEQDEPNIKEAHKGKILAYEKLTAVTNQQTSSSNYDPRFSFAAASTSLNLPTPPSLK